MLSKPPFQLTAPSRYGAAVLLTLAAASLRMALSPLLHASAPYLPFVLAVLMGSWLGGLGPGLVATFLSAVLAMLLFVEPHRTLPLGFPEQAGSALFLVTGILITLLGDALRRSWSRLALENARAQESERRLASTLGAIRDSVVVLDADWRFRYANAEALRVSGVAEEDILGRTFWEVFPLTRGTRLEEEFRRAVAERVPSEFEFRYEPWQMWFEMRVFPMPDGGLSVYALDITGRRTADEEAAVAQEQLRIVTESLSLPVTHCSRDLRYRWVNRPYAEWLGRRPEELIGARIQDVLGAEAFEKLQPHFERVLAGETVRYEQQVEFRGVGRRWIDAIYTPTWSRPGAPDGWVAVVLDIDARRRAEEALREADRRKDEFLATLAHELRNPLAPISNAVHLLRLKGPPDPELQWGRDLIDRQVQQLTRLVDELLDLSRITQGKISLQRERIPVSSFVTTAIETSQPLLTAGGHRLVVAMPPEPLFVLGDAVRLAQVVTNLLNNAAKYTVHPGHVELTVEPEGAKALIRVRDDGIGIPPEMLDRVFDLFAQVERGADRPLGGLGIGLTLVRRLVEMHEGTVEARSDGPGHGAEFVVRLPLAAGEPQPPIPEAMPMAADGRRRRVLVVDDNRDAAESLARLLGALGYEVRTAYDGVSGVTAFAELLPDAVLLDLGMPGLSGFGAAARIRAQEGGAGVLLIAVTGWGQPADRTRSREAGFDHHLTKPVDPAVLAGLLSGASIP